MKTLIAATAIALSLMTVATPANAVVLIDGATTQGLYNNSLGDMSTDGFMNSALHNGNGTIRMFSGANMSQGDPNASFPTAPDFSAAASPIAAALGNWLTSPATPGGNWSGLQTIPAGWAINTETAIIYTLSSPAGLGNVVANFGVDNGVFVWLNGVYKFGATAPGGAVLTEYTLNLGNLAAGDHHLQILRTDHGVATDWKIQVTGDVQPAGPGATDDVPAPATLLLLGAVLAGLGLARRAA